MVRPVEPHQRPSFLRQVTYLSPRGNATAEIISELNKRLRTDIANVEEVREQRSRRLEGYIELGDQIKWFSVKAANYQRFHRSCYLLSVLFAVAIPIFSFVQHSLAQLLTATLGAMIAFLLVLGLLGNCQVKYLHYRSVAERLQRERRKYLNLTTPYTAGLGENRAFDLFVETIEQILQEKERA